MFLFIGKASHSFRTNPFLILITNMSTKQSLVKHINVENISLLHSTTTPYKVMLFP